MKEQVERQEGEERGEHTQAPIPEPTKQDHGPGQRGHADDERDEDESTQESWAPGASVGVGAPPIYRGPATVRPPSRGTS